MDSAAKVTSKGQVTVPKDVRDALGIHQGDTLIFHIDGERAFFERTPNFLDLAGSIAVPDSARNASWDEVIKRSRAARTKKFR